LRPHAFDIARVLGQTLLSMTGHAQSGIASPLAGMFVVTITMLPR
jgi:hypothetical protein